MNNLEVTDQNIERARLINMRINIERDSARAIFAYALYKIVELAGQKQFISNEAFLAGLSVDLVILLGSALIIDLCRTTQNRS